MLSTLPAIVHEGKIELLEPIDLREGTRVLVTVLPDEDTQFWLQLDFLTSPELFGLAA